MSSVYGMIRRLAPFLLLLLATAAPAAAADPTYTTVRLKGAGGGQEPRIAVGRDDARYAVTLSGGTAEGEPDTGEAVGGHEIVFRSRDGGLTWQKTESDPPQREASIDVDIVTMPTGRILSSELDYGGLNFPTGYSDDGGKTWTESRGANVLSDQDRQWFAVGPMPKDAKPGDQPPVYLLYHNLGSGVAQHNMFVATSDDGGETFGPPVPVAQPGSDAYQDLQCSDSGGPSNITVNPKTGRIYAFYTTRAAPTPAGVDAGGCGAPIFGQPIEFNIVNGTRVWVATSEDGSPGSWTNSLAVDDSVSQQVVSMQLAYGALDNAGNVYVAYPESPRAYPDLEGSGIKLRWQKPDAGGLLSDKAWSKPATLVAPDPTEKIVGGADLVHLVAGDPGRVAVAYYYGEPTKDAATPFYSHILQSYDAMSPTPHVIDSKVSDVPAYKWSVGGMMGLCQASKDYGPLQGVYAGVRCARSTDVWGIALDAQCRVMSVWTANASRATAGSTKGLPLSQDGTFVTTQTGGSSLCAPKAAGAPSALPGGSQGAVYQAPPGAAIPGEQPSNGPGSGSLATGGSGSGEGCRDTVRPASSVRGGVKVSRKRISLRGTAIDHGCGVKGAQARARVRSVAVAVGRLTSDRTGCTFLRGDGKFGPRVSCIHPTFIVASGRAAWSLSLKGHFAKGRYIVWSRATDVVGNRQRKPRGRHLTRFRVR